MSISYDYYKIFYYVAEYHSFNKAASVLGNSQPNISRAIANLESQLGCRLFTRSSKGAELTSAGKELFSHVEAAYRHLAMGEEIVRMEAGAQSSILSIGISVDLTGTVVLEMIAPVINEFRAEHPDIRIEIRHAAPQDLISDISNSLLDMAFITTTDRSNADKEKYHKKIIHSYKDTIIAGNAFSELKDRVVPLRELAGYPLMSLGPGSETYQSITAYFAGHGLQFKPALETVSMGQILIYSIANLGIGVIHPKDAQEAIERGKIFEVKIREKVPQKYIAVLLEKKEKNAALLFEKELNDRRKKRAGHSAK